MAALSQILIMARHGRFAPHVSTALAQAASAEFEAMQDRIANLEYKPAVNPLSLLPFSISPQESACLTMLMQRQYITRSGLYVVLYSNLPESDQPAEKISDVWICKLGRRLAPFGISIQRRGWGGDNRLYYLDQTDKDRIRAMIAEAQS